MLRNSDDNDLMVAADDGDYQKWVELNEIRATNTKF